MMKIYCKNNKNNVLLSLDAHNNLVIILILLFSLILFIHLSSDTLFLFIVTLSFRSSYVILPCLDDLSLVWGLFTRFFLRHNVALRSQKMFSRKLIQNMSPSNERKEKSIKLGIDDNSKASLNSFERKKKTKI